MPIISQHFMGKGFPDDTKEIAELLKFPVHRQQIWRELDTFLDEYRFNSDLLRFHKIHDPVQLLRSIDRLSAVKEQYKAVEGFAPAKASFVTEDEITHLLKRGGDISEAKLRIYAYFMQGHDAKECAQFLKESYGEGGYGRQGYNENHGTKGISLTREDEESGYTTGPFDLDAGGSNWSRGWQAADEYLSGDVRRKLHWARLAAEKYPEFAVNVEKLEQVQPKDLTASEISVRIGASWVGPEYYQQFMFELLYTPLQLQERSIRLMYAETTGEWRVQGKSGDSRDNVRVYATYGTKRVNAYEIFEAALNQRDVRVFDKTVVDGKEVRVLNEKQTAIAQQKQEALCEAFKDWIFKDPQRREVLCKKYNEMFNNIRPREYDGSHINFSGMNSEISLRPHQQNAVAHILYGKNTLLAHCVGAGKSATRS